MNELKFILLLCIMTGVGQIQAQTIGAFELKKDGRASGGYGEAKMKKAPKKAYIAQFRVMYQLLYSKSQSTVGR